MTRASAEGWTRGPWSYRKFAQSGQDLAEIEELGLKPTMMLTNDGSAMVMAGDDRVALVDCQTKFKRGEGYRAECPRREANARLIAAAPDLYEALATVMVALKVVREDGNEFPDFDAWEKAARAALAKATGEQP